MKMKDFIAGILTGVAAGFLVNEAVKRLDRNIAPESVLHNIKESFREEGPIDGSWIIMKTEPFTNQSIHMDVYRGGISRIKNGNLEQYEFAANAKTGTVVEMTRK